jgi:hypothetical protein
VLKNARRAATVDGSVVKIEMMGIANMKLNRQAQSLSASSSFGNHGLAAVDADHPAMHRHPFGEKTGVGARTASDVKQVCTFGSFQEVEGVLRVCTHGTQGADRV